MAAQKEWRYTVTVLPRSVVRNNEQSLQSYFFFDEAAARAKAALYAGPNSTVLLGKLLSRIEPRPQPVVEVNLDEEESS